MFGKTLANTPADCAAIRPITRTLLMTAIALGFAGALLPFSATATTATPSAVQTAAASASDETDAAPSGFRAKMRARVQERMQERKKEFEEKHPPIDKNLSQDQIRDIVAGRLAMSGNANLKVGKVTAKEDGIVAVEIVTKSGALADVREISTKTGLPANMESWGAHHMMGGKGGGREFAARLGASRHGTFHRGEENRRDLALTVDQVRKLAEARLIMIGNKNLKVGAVKERDPDAITVDIVAADNSLVTQRVINRHTGKPIRHG